MESRQGRSIDVDFVRGVVLIVIVLDHIPGSALSQLTLHTYALCDSAEVFVFLGGYASARGIAPETLLATDIAQTTNGRTRPLCRYPAFPRYTGKGSLDRASSFTCATS